MTLEDHDANSFVPEGKYCLSLELRRDENSLEQIVSALSQATQEVLARQFLVLVLRSPATWPPSRVWLHKGIWNALGNALTAENFKEVGASVWIPADSSRQVDGFLAGLAVPSQEAVGRIAHRAAGGDSLVLLLGSSRLIDDVELVGSLASNFGAKPSTWKRFVVRSSEADMWPVRCSGAFDDQASAVRVFADPAELKRLQSWLISSGLAEAST
jgi:hypothetical protein